MSLEHSTVSFVQSVIQQSMDCYLLLTTTGALSHSFGLWSIYALLFIYLMIIFALVRIFDFYWGGIERLCNFSASKPVPAGTGTNRFSQYIFSLWLRYNRFLQIWIRWNHKVGLNENWWVISDDLKWSASNCTFSEIIDQMPAPYVIWVLMNVFQIMTFSKYINGKT